jgi:hypothetical protein
MSNLNFSERFVGLRSAKRNDKPLNLLVFLALVVFVAPLNPSIIHAADFHSPRSVALGGAGRAGPLLNDAILLNPSFAAFLKERVSAGFSYLTHGTNQDDRTYQVSLQDGRSPFFEAGLSYTRLESGSMIHFGASRSFIQRTGFGLGAKFLRPTHEGPLIADASLSATAIITPEIQAALVVDNLVQGDLARANGNYREIALGTKINIMKMILLYIDPHYTPELPSRFGERLGYSAGAELVMFQDVFLRAGTYRNAKQPILNSWGNGWGLGAGWLSPKISFDIGYTQATTPAPATLWNLGATFYL